MSLISESSAADKPINFKLGTLAPSGSSYHQNLQALGEKWRALSGGTVKLTIFPGGTQGGEVDMVGLMQTGSLDAGLLTAVGLSEIEPKVNALQAMPMAFRDLGELDYVREKLRPQLEQNLLAKGYVVLFWGDTGWVRFFTKPPILHPDELRKLKLLIWAGNTDEYDLWKANGFNPVALETKDLAQGLFSGTGNAICMPPVFALFGQLDSQVGHMLDLNWGPLVGAAVVRQKSWERIPENLRESFLKAAAETGLKVKEAGRAENEASVAAMVKRGLKVQKLSPEITAEWLAAAEKVYDRIRGRIVPAETFDAAQKLIKEYRASSGGK